MILEKCVLSLRVGNRVGILTGSFDARKGAAGRLLSYDSMETLF